MKTKNDKCVIVAEVTAYTKYPNGTKKRGRLEREIESFLKDCYEKYMKTLVTQIPGSEKWSWKQVNKNTIELITEAV